MKAEAVAQKIVNEYGTGDVFAIAERAAVKIVYESWYPVTIGEFERKTSTIRVNRAALEKSENAERLEKKIIAHELGHFFAAKLNLDKLEEETFAHDFAEQLIKKVN